MARHSDGKRRGSSGWLSAIVLLLLLAGLVVLFRQPLAGLAFVLTGGSMSMTEAVDNRPLGYFYRFTAHYSHKGEPLVFDYVVACNIRVTRYRGGDRSDDSTYTPKVMMLPTKTGGAVMVRTIRACNGQTTENGRVPEDLFPLAIWFDDVNDMTFGWGYASVAAYESELSQLEFHEARIAPATRADWDAWREASAKDFEPIGMITTPWGVTYNEPSARRDPTKPLETSKRLLARVCFGYHRLEVPENVRARINLHRPKSKKRYWSPPSTVKMESILAKGVFPSGKNYWDHVSYSSSLYAGAYGIPRRNGNGTLRKEVRLKTDIDIFPLLPASQVIGTDLSEPADKYPRKILTRSGKMNGFLACGGDAPHEVNPFRFDSNFVAKPKPFYVNDLMLEAPHITYGEHQFIFDRDQFVYISNPAGSFAP